MTLRGIAKPDKWLADVAHALVRAVSRLTSTTVGVQEDGRRQKCRHATHECVRHVEMACLFRAKPL
jgi:hypothetical protein